MSTMATKLINTPPPEALKRTFDIAIAELSQRTAARTPIAMRNRIAANFMTQAEIEKRAVESAARALAQLWKISPHKATSH